MIPYTKPYLTGSEQAFLAKALAGSKLSGNGPVTQECQALLARTTCALKALLTQSCTAAIEMAALLLDLEPGDEVILPSFTFVSSANPFVLQKARPVFVDIRPDTFNLNEQLLEEAITPRTRAIVPVHYAGVACAMEPILATAQKHGLKVVCDSAQAMQAFYQGKPLAGLGHLSAVSFHDTKNIISGEGGTLLINSPEFLERSEVLWEKGTNRSRFLRGEVDKYTWVDVGSSFLPSELTASFLLAQLHHAQEITELRLQAWNEYYERTEPLEQNGFVRRPVIPEDCTHNAHIFHVLLNERVNRAECIAFLKSRGIQAVSHYVPLHSSPAGLRFGRTCGDLSVTDSVAERLLRLPLWPGLKQVDFIVDQLSQFFHKAISCD